MFNRLNVERSCVELLLLLLMACVWRSSWLTNLCVSVLLVSLFVSCGFVYERFYYGICMLIQRTKLT